MVKLVRHKDFLWSFLLAQGKVQNSHILLSIQLKSFSMVVSFFYVKALKQISLRGLSVYLIETRKAVCSLKNMLVLEAIYLLHNFYRSLLKTSAATKMLQEISYTNMLCSKFKRRLTFRFFHQTRLLHLSRTLLVGWRRTGRLLYFLSTTGTEAEFYKIESLKEFCNS